MKIIYLGTNYFAAEILQNLLIKKLKISYVLCKPDSKFGRGLKLNAYPVKNVAIKNKLKFHSVLSINSLETEQFLMSVRPDIIIVVEYGEKINKNIFSIPKYGIINIHPSLLPLLKGPTPIEHAIIYDYKETGVSLIKINEILDSGDIINYKSCKIKKDENYISLFNKLKKISVNILIKSLKQIKLNKIIFIKQNDFPVSYTKKLTKDFYKIKWNNQALCINRYIRSTFKKHYTSINEIIVNIIDTSVVKGKKNKNYKPGVIINISKYGIDVATAKDILRIKKIQLPGKKINTVYDILNSNKKIFFVGNLFI